MTSEKKFIGVVSTDGRKILLAIDNISSIEEDAGTTVIMTNGSEYSLRTDIHAFDFCLSPTVERTDGYKNQ